MNTNTAMTNTPVRSPQAVLKQVFGYKDFRDGQEAIIAAALDGQDSLVLLPTGGGKSLCYQVPALILDGVTVVISPLISLMQDQVAQLKALGVQAAYINNSLPFEEQQAVYQQLHYGQIKLLYVAPEKVLQHEFLERLSHLKLALFAIDEAHCVSHWGHDFRPHYCRLNELKQRFMHVPMMALTATADKATRYDIIEQLQLNQPYVHTGSFDRPNIRYTIEEKFKPMVQLLRYLKEQQNQSGIIYCTSRKRVDDVAEKLADAGFNAAAYHAGMSNEQRQFVQSGFARDDIQIVVATVAFGMGINKPNVRFVVHYDIPKSVEAYYQETGRAGRDGLAAEAIMYFDPADIGRVRRFFEDIEDEQRRRVEEQRFNAMASFAEAQTCRRQILLNYFSEYKRETCGNCDICLNPPTSFDGTLVAQQALSCVYRAEQRFGIGYIVELLRGANTSRIRDNNHHQLSTYGIGKDHSVEFWLSILRQLIHQGLLSQDITQGSSLRLTEAARAVLKSEYALQLAEPRLQAKHVYQDKLAQFNYDKKLFARLRALRKELADADDVPPYVVFNDKTLAEMAQLMPTNDSEFLKVSGVGFTKLNKYGSPFLNTIRDYLAAH
ncbi:MULTISPECIES: DNA helicase RecQ [Pseudoalteromonas]|jgi:ATP-dependent DNA helicase RecQ|uniref:DNA helicase RecQ n=1 Tax=Pseudoalteromonas lipolytica TaxID=570156 RepID=A0AAD0WDF9_9GAMM|nr:MULTISPECIES: DNA helicase RecQ [Pseudoalteromonas]AXV66340.1 DNA helicase RecQ [Pseudoalteromonas donghaensis]EWH04975.1 ATP-dependent DNA helicase RecQ [Pseudoalteromonas lipolytica SCSIO 04301]MAE01116.1 DNA helicase RecQ [Pseudoalteromonas sp.]MBE0349774.1 ATP-dependent DNA helicase RecQ [Pseudoalteromonas lipolytica LMEB 39]MCC9660827.1 DNA helicase RecQ [Pseudoalteromonas sp. MB41]|tara:strand:+ start:303 stop:2126 length:1824 start_codon:yes stop_codon:yes gene_type:complete